MGSSIFGNGGSSTNYNPTYEVPNENRFQFTSYWTCIPCFCNRDSSYKSPSLNSSGRASSGSTSWPYYPIIQHVI